MSDILSFLGGSRGNRGRSNSKQSEDLYLTYSDPSPEEACSLINYGRSRYVIVLFGNLCAHYEGRARAELELAPRILILKPDGTLLIHESTKREPVIWQPPRALCYASVENGVLVVKSTRTNPPESVRIEIPSIYFLGMFKVASTPSYRVIGTEKDLVDFIVSNVEVIEQGLQVLAREYQTPVGNIDILARDKDGNLVVIEVKRGQAGPEAVHQLKRYVDFIQSRNEGKVRGILVAQDISSLAYRYLRDYGFKFARIPRRIFEKVQQGFTLDF